jgi:ribokinase
VKKITVIGSLNMDLIVNTPRIPILGETILGNGFMTAPGGKGANQAVAAARLGAQVCMIGCVGNDSFGKDLIENLRVNNVSTEYIKVIDGVSTGVAIIVVKGGDNFIIVDPGANSRLTCEMIDSLEEVIKKSSMVVIQLEIPIETVYRAIKIAKKHGVKVLLNPAPAHKLSDDILSMVDIFTPNESESEIITGLPIKSVMDAKKAVMLLKEKGVANVIVTMGSKGAVYSSGNQIIHKPVDKVMAVDTTAAGDSFTGAIATAIMKRNCIDEAVNFANIVGTLTVMKRGAQPSLPFLQDVQNYKSLNSVIK